MALQWNRQNVGFVDGFLVPNTHIMSRHTQIIAGIDVGTHQIKVAVVRVAKSAERNVPQLLGTGFADSRGIRNGYIISEAEVAKSIKTAVAMAEKNAGVPIKRAYVSLGSIGLDEIEATGEIIPARADSEITDHDLEKVAQDCEDRIADRIPNRRILHIIPLRYRVDGELVLGRATGMQGTKLEADCLFITAYEQHLHELTAAVGQAGVMVEDVTASPLAASFVLLNKAQKRAGCVLANIGAETVSIVVFEDFLPISVKVFPIGSNDITNDLALGLKIPIEEAEKAKRGGMTSMSLPKKKVEEIIAARLTDIFELIDNHLKKIKRDGLLPAGIILTGGGSNLLMAQDTARDVLNLPARFANLELNKNTKMKDASWTVAYGLCLLGASSSDERNSIGINRTQRRSLWGWFSQFLP